MAQVILDLSTVIEVIEALQKLKDLRDEYDSLNTYRNYDDVLFKNGGGEIEYTIGDLVQAVNAYELLKL